VTESQEAAGKAASRLFINKVSQAPGLVLLPGGKSPIPFYRELANDMLNWDNISIMPTDDRVVPLNNIYSNTGMIQRELFGRISTNSSPQLIKVFPENDKDIDNSLFEIKEIFKRNLPNIAFLGMGSDGHTAGIFGEGQRDEYVYYFQNKEDNFKRITISMRVLMKIPNLVFLIMGKEKRGMLTKVISNWDSKNYTPIGYLLRNGIGLKSIICDIQAAPKGFTIGETELVL